MSWVKGDGVFVQDPEDNTLVYGTVVKQYDSTDSVLVCFERGGFERLYTFGATELMNWNVLKSPQRILVCVCGSDSIGAPKHSAWCEKYAL